MGLWSLSNKSILIVDDFAQMRTMLASMLKNYRPELVLQAANGIEALEKINNNSFDIILCDYNLGSGKDGQQILEEVRHLRLISFNTLFIMITAENSNQMVMGAAEYLPDAYLAKPINKNVLIARLQKLMQKKQTFLPLSEALDNNDFDKVIASCDILLEKNTKFKLEILSIKCEHLIKQDKYDEALSISNDVLEQRNIPWAMNIVGLAHIHNQKFIEAEDTFRKIIAADKSFMPAYDSLAKILDNNNDFAEAQSVLSDAISISPKSVSRQRKLANACIKNNDLTNAEKARKHVIDVGRTSCLKESTDYTVLADMYISKGLHEKAANTLNDVIKTFRDDDQTVLESSIKISTAYKKMNNSYKYNSYVNSSLKLAEKNNHLLHGDAALELAKNCMELGKPEKGKDILMSVAKEFCDDAEMITSINAIFEEAGMHDEGEKIISSAKSEIIELNNKGVKLIKSNKIDDAIKLFQLAVKQMPGNITITLNIATSLFLYMQKNGLNKQTLMEVDNYLDSILRIDSKNRKALDIKHKCKSLS